MLNVSTKYQKNLWSRKNNCNFVIKNDNKELIMDDIDVAKPLNQKFVSIRKTFAA